MDPITEDEKTEPELTYITRQTVVPWVADNGLRVEKRTSRSITLRWESPRPIIRDESSSQPSVAKMMEESETEEDETSDTDDDRFRLPPPPFLGGQRKESLPRIPLYTWKTPKRNKEKSPDLSGQNLFEVQMKKTGALDWTTIYKGYAKRFDVEDLKPDSNISFRMRCNSENEWGTSIVASTDSPPPNAEDLHRAIYCNHEDMVLRIVGSCKPTYLKKLLVSHDRSGHTPLMTAALNANPDLVKLLLKVGADVNAIALNTEKTALMLACFKGDLSCVQLLDTTGANWELRDSSGCNAVHYAVNGESPKVLKYALQKRGTEAIEEKDNSGWTPLLRAIIVGSSTEIVRILLRNGANPDVVDSKNTKSCILAAAMLGKLDFIKVLLEYNVNINYTNGNGQKAIDIATSKGFTEIVKTLKKALRKPEREEEMIEILKPHGDNFKEEFNESTGQSTPSTFLGENPRSDYLEELERRLSNLAMESAKKEMELHEQFKEISIERSSEKPKHKKKKSPILDAIDDLVEINQNETTKTKTTTATKKKKI